MFGAHLSIAGGLVNALDEAERLGLDCVQVFTKNQRRWSVPALRDEERRAWLSKLRALGWARARPSRVASHASYLINVASPDPAIRRRSVAMLRTELERCEALLIPLLVVHPGAHCGQAAPAEVTDDEWVPGPDERRGLRRVAGALDRVHRDLAGYRVVTCLETTAGAGTTLGYDFRQLAWIRANVGQPRRVGFCFDTCHVTAAGYDMTTRSRAQAVLERFDACCGLRRLRVFHLNDSVGAVASRRDRHAHIGQGACGLACFRAIVNTPAFGGVPKIIETPKGENDKGVPWDVANIRRLKRLSR